MTAINSDTQDSCPDAQPQKVDPKISLKSWYEVWRNSSPAWDDYLLRRYLRRKKLHFRGYGNQGVTISAHPYYENGQHYNEHYRIIKIAVAGESNYSSIIISYYYTVYGGKPIRVSRSQAIMSAVQCAIDIQKHIATKPYTRPQSHRERHYGCDA